MPKKRKTPTKLIVFDFGNSQRRNVSRWRPPRVPDENWCQKTREAYTEAHDEIKRTAVRVGSDVDPCWRLYDKKEVKIQFIDSSGQLQRFFHLPYKLAYLAQRKRNVPCGTEVSHLCGDTRCINPDHLVAESHRINTQRHKCHEVIRKWIADEMKKPNGVQRGKYTFLICKKRLCRHGRRNPKHDCFVMEGFVDIRNHKCPPGPRRIHPQYLLHVLHPRRSSRLSWLLTQYIKSDPIKVRRLCEKSAVMKVRKQECLCVDVTRFHTTTSSLLTTPTTSWWSTSWRLNAKTALHHVGAAHDFCTRNQVILKWFRGKTREQRGRCNS